MKRKSLFALALILGSTFLMVGCSGSSDPEVDKSVPLGSNNDKFKPTSVQGAGGGNGTQSGGLGTPGAQ